MFHNLKFSRNWTGYPDNKTDASEIANDTNRYKKLMIVGNKSAGAERRVGVWDRLDVHGTLTARNPMFHNMKLSRNWTGYPDNKTDASEIANDTNRYKKLMIVGNKSAGAERRVGVWDKLDVHGNLEVHRNIQVGRGMSITGNEISTDGRIQNGRLHIAPKENLHVGAKGGIHINTWNNLNADPSIYMTSSDTKKANLCMDGQCLTSADFAKIKRLP